MKDREEAIQFLQGELSDERDENIILKAEIDRMNKSILPIGKNQFRFWFFSCLFFCMFGSWMGRSMILSSLESRCVSGDYSSCRIVRSFR